MTIVCQQCGWRNTGGEQFCANPACGAYLGWQGDPTAVGTAAVPPAGPGPVEPATTGMPGPATTGGGRAAAVVVVAEPELAVAPGESVTTTATVHNGASRVEQFTVTVTGPAGAWATVEPAALSVYPGEQAECRIRFAPPRHPGTAAGRAWFTVRAVSAVHGIAAEAAGRLTVGEFRQLAATLHPPRTSGRRRTWSVLELTNTGNVQEPVRVQGRDQVDQLRFTLPAGEVPVNPGVHRLRVGITAPMKLFGQSRSFPYHLEVTPRPPTAPIRLDGNREAVPLISGCLPIALAIVTVVALVCGGAIWLGLNVLDIGGSSGNGNEEPTEEPTEQPTEGPEVVAPALLSPEDGAVFDIFPRETTLTWEAVPGAQGYVVEVEFCQQEGCETSARPLEEETLPASQTSFTFNFVGAQPGRWRVTALFPGGEQATSDFRGFRYTR